MASVELAKVSVEFPLFGVNTRSLKQSVVAWAMGAVPRFDSERIVRLAALDGITLSLKEGDRLGIVGHNGAGKTTLLRVLARIYPPSAGTVRIEGRVSSLIDVTLGFDLHATGYENIYLRGLLLGFRRAEIDAKVPDIAEFTGLDEYLHLPASTYSSGMLLRLGLAVSTAFEPEILLMDEWMSVGDVLFLQRAQQRVNKHVGKARILVLASHAADLIRQNCNRCIWLHRGRIVAEGAPDEVLRRYQAEPQPAAATLPA